MLNDACLCPPSDTLCTVGRPHFYCIKRSLFAYVPLKLFGTPGIARVFSLQSRPPVQLVACSTPKRGTQLYYRITRTATRERVARFLPILCDNFKYGFNVSWACIKLALFLVAPLFFLPPVEPGVYFLVQRHQANRKDVKTSFRFFPVIYSDNWNPIWQTRTEFK